MAMTFASAHLTVLRSLKFHETLKDSVKQLQQNILSSKKEDDVEDLDLKCQIKQRTSKLKLARICAVVGGIELCYAAETAFVSPIMMKLGVPVALASLTWCISPLIGFFVLPILGGISDQCQLEYGKRRPFIIALSVAILIGSVVVSNAPASYDLSTAFLTNFTTNSTLQKVSYVNDTIQAYTVKHQRIVPASMSLVIVTCLGVALMDSCCDACQSPSRAYMLDVTPHNDHSRGLSLFTVLAGFGGAAGYAFGYIDWSSDTNESAPWTHERIVFGVLSSLFVICLLLTITAADESKSAAVKMESYPKKNLSDEPTSAPPPCYATFNNFNSSKSFTIDTKSEVAGIGMPSDHLNIMNKQLHVEKHPSITVGEITEQLPSEVTLRMYLQSVIQMPKSLRMLCLTNLFSWMALVSYSLFFTDYVGQAVFGGDPESAPNSSEHQLYNDGVRLGSLAMAIYSTSCCLYSLGVEWLIEKIGLRAAYVSGCAVASVGALSMTIFPRVPVVIFGSITIGILYSTLFTMPYILIASYHMNSIFTYEDENSTLDKVRGLGTDIALVSSMVFLGQLIVASLMGSLVYAMGSTTITCLVSAIFSAMASLMATQVLILPSFDKATVSAAAKFAPFEAADVNAVITAEETSRQLEQVANSFSSRPRDNNGLQ